MNKLTQALLIGAVAANKEFSKDKMIAIVEGVLKGAIEAEGFTDIESCVKDIQDVTYDLEVAVADFETKDVKKVADGI